MKLINSKKISAVGITTFSLFLLLFSNFSMSDEDEENDEGREDGKIELSQQQIKHSEIELSRVSGAMINESFSVYGRIERNAEKEQMISARYEGRIIDITKRVGDKVNKGDSIVTIEGNESLREYTLRSEINGVIVERNVNRGEQSGGDVLFVIQDFSDVWVELSVFPKNASKVHIGQKVRVISIDKKIVSEGEIIYIPSLSNQTNQAMIVRVLLNNVERKWRPGDFVNAEVILSETLVDMAIKNNAIQILDGKPSVFVKEGDLFEARNITIGRSDGEYSEVLLGVKKGESYVVKNSFILKSEIGKGEIEDDD